MTGTLYLVATPIGNLEDLTFRAKRVLTEVDKIACEDTRTSRVLLSHYGITTNVTSYHKFNEREKTDALIGALLEGQNIALITDAGTPLISDPGMILVKECHKAGIPVTSLPGACAAVTAASLSGQDSRRFVFEGFLPSEKKECSERLNMLAKEERTIILYEAPHHLKKTLAKLFEAFGDREMTLCRELTKKFETVTMLTIREAIDQYEQEEPRGEYVLVIAGRPENEAEKEAQERWKELSVEEHMQFYESEGYDKKEAMKLVAKDRGVSKREIYQMLL